MLQRGFTVKISLSTANISTGGVPVLIDDNGAVYTLASNERFILTDVTVVTGGGIIEFWGSSTLSTHPYVSFSSTATEWHTDYEGMSFPHATLPWIVATTGGLVLVGGTGYVIEDGGYTLVPPFVPVQSGLINS